MSRTLGDGTHPSQGRLAEVFGVDRGLLFPPVRATDGPHSRIISGPKLIDGYRVTVIERPDGSTATVRVPRRPVAIEVSWIAEDSPASDRLLADVLTG